MTDKNNKQAAAKTEALKEGEAIEKGFEQMAMIYKSRCVQMPTSSNVTVTEIKKER